MYAYLVQFCLRTPKSCCSFVSGYDNDSATPPYVTGPCKSAERNLTAATYIASATMFHFFIFFCGRPFLYILRVLSSGLFSSE